MLVCEDLLENGLHIWVEKPGFSYGADAVALAGFARLRAGERALDLCAGTGVLAILLQGRSGASFLAVEKEESLCALLRRSAADNGQRGIETLCLDLRALRPGPGRENFDAAVCNPPYFAGGTPCPDAERQLARHQDGCVFADVAACAGRMLRPGGRFYVCYPRALFADACYELIANGLQPKRVRPCGKILLLEARKGGRPGGLVWEEL